MIETIFANLGDSYIQNEIDTETTYYFSIDDTKKTIVLTPETCRVEDGKTVDNAYCICKTDSEFFQKIWNEGYRPGVSDFMSGKIKSNNPMALKDFLEAFGK